MRYGWLMAATALAMAPATARQSGGAAIVRPERVKAHVDFLAGPALRGRGSATPDEAVAAAYVAAQFAGGGLRPAPGMNGYTQTAHIVRWRVTGSALLTLDGVPLAPPTLLQASGDEIVGGLAVFTGSDLATLPRADVVVATAGDPRRLAAGAARQGVRLLLVPESEAAKAYVRANGPRMPRHLQGEAAGAMTTVAMLPPDQIARVAAKPGARIGFVVPAAREIATTTNAVGFLPGTDPAAGVILVTAHLDHLGVAADGMLFPGANDDASGTTAVLELARTLSVSRAPRRGILFVCYGSEEIGGFGSRWFGAHPPVPLSGMVANIEIEMIGSQDPKQPVGQLMMTGFDRSNLGPELRRHGALIGPDAYPAQRFFERSDNYQLALEGVVAHTVSGFPVPPTYHQPTDTAESLDIGYMTRAIQSLVAPIRWLANSRFIPSWKTGGRPSRQP